MQVTEQALNVLTALRYPGIGRAWIVKNLSNSLDLEELVYLLNNKLKEKINIEIFENDKEEVRNRIHILGDSCDGVVAIGDKDFPKHRGKVSEGQQPVVLFYKGNLDLLQIDNNNITVIGLLNPDETIEKRERRLVDEIVKHGITIVSGLANGCDAIAHEQSIKTGKTIAILPSPLNDILPAGNRMLADEILEEGGLLITEYYEKFTNKNELSSRYVERDRLQALYCDTIILISSYSKESSKKWNIAGEKLDSGARHAMEYAKKYGIPRAVMYNKKTDENNPKFDLNRELLGEENSDVIVLTDKNLKRIITTMKYSSGNLFDSIA